MNDIKNDIDCWIESLKDSNLKVKDKREVIVIEGIYYASYFLEGFETYLNDRFELIISVDKKYPIVLPIVKELSGKIPKDFHKNGENFCMGVPMEMLMYSRNNPVSEFFKKYLDSYLMTYIFFNKYGFFPNGERKHGIEGIYEHLVEYFQVENYAQILKLLNALVERKLSRNQPCPCGSGKKLKKCHLESLEAMKIKVNKREIVKTIGELKKHGEI